MKIKNILAAFAITGVSLLSTSSFANSHGERGAESEPPMHRMGPGMSHDMGHGMHRAGGLHHALKQLNLTEEQKSTLKSLKESNATGREEKRATMEKLHQEMAELLHADTIDEAAIKALSAKLADLRAEEMIFHAKMRQQVMSILTEEQKAQLKQMKQKRVERMKRRLELED